MKMKKKKCYYKQKKAPSFKWVYLKRRTLQQWGGQPNINGMKQERLPKWLVATAWRLKEIGIFLKEPNHVLLNKYEPGQGIMAHTDGNLYFPCVAIVSLGSSCVMDFYKTHQDSRDK